MSKEIKDKKEEILGSFAENTEKNLNFYFGNKIDIIYNFGKDIFFELNYEDLPDVLESLKNNPDFNFDVLSSIKYRKSSNFLLIVLFSYEKSITLNIKIRNSVSYLNFDLNDAIGLLKKIFKFSPYYSNRDYIKDINNDLIVFSQIPETLDTFDLYVSLNKDLIKNAYICDEISRYNADIVFNCKEINKIISMVNNLDYKAGIYPELCFCLGIENLLQIKLPKRAVYIRMLLCELFRLACHLSYIISMSMILKNMTIFNYTLMEREKVLNVIEIITGSRIIPNFIRIGGVSKDIEESTLDLLYKLIPQLYKNLRKIEDLFSSDVVVLERLRNKGIIDNKKAKTIGLTGPNLRASGIRFDLRKSDNYLLYRDFAFTVPLGRSGDSLDRIFIRFKEMYQSLKIISAVIGTMPLGAVGKMINPENLDLIPSKVISTVECPHGIFKMFIEIRENKDIQIIPIGPTKNNMIACEMALIGFSADDLLPVVSSFGIESPEMY
ncbi:MAG: hypothetical protein PHR39_00550 [Actinomycetota bacterium]|nr:hypothetical protein [Actinomycetota bacterium]